ncbi:MAG TPA: caspase family protein [Thermoanaerobaculia bacterium]
MRVMLLCFLAFGASAQSALLIGIDDYTASHLPASGTPAPGREWPDLPGPVNDVRAFATVLPPSTKIVTLTNQDATRAAILQALERLARDARRDEVVLFYFSGHGSQVRNSLSDERDRLDESLVPADSRRGARDIRDKELRPHFNRILDRGARLVVILDSCHSGSGARAMRPRGIAADLRDVADRSRHPRPEDRGALVLSATQDFDLAFDMRVDGKFQGVFSWALLQALRDAFDESAEETFLRAQALVKRVRRDQEPVLAGNAAARRRPLFGARIERADRVVVAISQVREDVVLQGGWAHGLSVGSTLHAGDVTLTVTELCGPALSIARASSNTLRPGALAIVDAPDPRWRTLASPPSPYRLHIFNGDVIAHHLIGGRRYELRARAVRASGEPHYLYAFAIDSAGTTTLLFPRHGSVENRFRASGDIPLAHFRAVPPYGIDTFVLLATDTPLPNPWVLQRDGVRGVARTSWSVTTLQIPNRGVSNQ